MSLPENGLSYFYNVVGGDYFTTMAVPLLQGRSFSDRDDAGPPLVAVVNDAFVQAVWPGQSAIGKRFHINGDEGPIVEIVGVVRGMQDIILGETPKTLRLSSGRSGVLSDDDDAAGPDGIGSTTRGRRCRRRGRSCR